ncbi:MAG: hypothetical protein FWH37_08350 [Candidatus Bathyarchaeota archaeon]|nr:hypothetical protein [Candidatus Termiticorpusculum sp.]
MGHYRNLVVCIVICATFILLSAEFQQIPIVSATTSTNFIVAYGAEAQIFASILSTKWSELDLVLDNQPQIIVISDINLVNLQDTLDSMKNGAILVAINLPVDNGLVDVPRHSFGSTERIGLWTVKTENYQDVVPPYWIIVTKQTTPPFTGQYSCGTAEDEQSHEHVMQTALRGINSVMFPDVDWPNMSEVIDNGDQREVDNDFMVVLHISDIMLLAVLLVVVLLVGVITVVVLLLQRKPKI